MYASDQMRASIAEPAVLSRIGRTLEDLMDDVVTEPYPSALKELLSAQQQPNVFCALVQALANPDRYEISERDGEVSIVPRSDQS
jgi:hypothetical protein